MMKYLSGAEYHHLLNNHAVIVTLRPESNSSIISSASQKFLTFLLVCFLFISTSKAESISQPTPIRIGITPVILDQQLQFLRKWEIYLEAQLKQPVEFIQQDSYGKITTQLLKGELDFGWICGYPFVQHQAFFELVAVPLYNGKPLYQSYLIVSNRDTTTKSIQDLKNTVFAYSDPDSNSGYLYAQYRLKKANLNPDSFFKKTFFTWKHKNTVEAVAVGLANGGIIDGYIWESMKQQRHPLIDKTRVVHKSKLFGFPPIVATKYVPFQLKRKFQSLLLSMSKNEQGKILLDLLYFDGFIEGSPQLYYDIRQQHLFIEAQNNVAS